jgi:hypothetical protein
MVEPDWSKQAYISEANFLRQKLKLATALIQELIVGLPCELRSEIKERYKELFTHESEPARKPAG